MMESMSATMNSSRSSCTNNNDTPMSPIRERTKKAIAQHRAWRQPDLRRSYAGISVSAVSQRQYATTAPPLTTQPIQNDSNERIRSGVFPNIGVSHSGSSSIPFDAAAAIYEDIELSESRLIHDFNSSDSVHDHLQQIENLMLSPSMRSNVSSTSDRSANNTNLNNDVVDSSYPDEVVGNRLGIEANDIYDTNPNNEVDLIRRQQYVYESYRTLQNPSSSMMQSMSADTEARDSIPQPIVFRDDESAGTGMSQQELIRKKARTNRRKRLITKSKRPILQLPHQLLLPPRISTPHRQPYCAIQKHAPSASSGPSKPQRTANKSKSMDYEQYDDPEELESSSTTAETANESGETPPGGAVAVPRPQSSNTVFPTQDPHRQRRRYQQQPPTLAVRGDDALLWIEPIDQRSLGEESFLASSYRTSSRDGDQLVAHVNENATENLTKVTETEKIDNFQLSSNTKGPPSKTISQLPRTSVRFARSDGGRDDDESSMPWDQKTDLKGMTMNSPATVLDNIREEMQAEESPIKTISQTAVPKSILRKSRYKASRIGELNETNGTNDHVAENEIGKSQSYVDVNGDSNEPNAHSRDLSPPRMPIKMLDLEGLDLSPIPHGLESEHQSIIEDSADLHVSPPAAYIGHPAEKHIQKTMATFLAMRDGELADHVRDQDIYPDPPLEIDIDDDETVLSAYVFIETVAAIVIQTAVRQFLAVLYLDSLRQTQDSFDVAQRVLSIEESCIEESMNASSRATSSVEHETHDYSYETLIDDDLDRAAQDMYELAAIQIQSVYRGFWVRDCLDVDHYCATVLQRMYRGLRCRKEYARDMWRIVLVQSWCRRNIARENAANVLAYAIVIQSAVRAYIVRKRYSLYREKKLLVKHAAATSIQSRWRSFVCEAHFIRSLVDVLIVQTVVRKWIARQRVSQIRKDRIRATERTRLKSTLENSNIVAANESAKIQIEVDAPKGLQCNSQSEEIHSPVTLSSTRKTEGTNNSPHATHVSSQSKHTTSYGVSHASSAKIVNKKSMDVTIVNDAKWRSAAARCITPETKKMYTKSKVVAYPVSDDDGSSCNESYKIVRNSRQGVTTNLNVDQGVALIENSTKHMSADRVLSIEETLPEDVPKQGTTTNLLSIWKEKEKRNGYQHRKALV